MKREWEGPAAFFRLWEGEGPPDNKETPAMDVLVFLIPVALFLGFCGLAAFLWSLRSGQFDDLDGAAHRVLFDDEEDEEKKNQDDRS